MTDLQRGHSSGSGPVLDEPGKDEGAPTGPASCACGHSSASHDRVAARYCAATTAGNISRGCLCHEPSGPSPRY
jgi:hypothetical protein